MRTIATPTRFQRTSLRSLVLLLSLACLPLHADEAEESAPKKKEADVVVTAPKPAAYESPAGQTTTTISGESFKNAAAFSIGDVLIQTPGVTVQQGNGPRDVSVSVRGSNARQTFGIRNIQVLEDGFPFTQPDGLARTDLMDPHAYAGIDVFQGPAGALYGNYATSGAVNFRTRTGLEINGVEVGGDVGGFGYKNGYVSFGHRQGAWDYALFGSYVAGDGFTSHTAYHTTTLNFLTTYTATPRDRITVKFVNNDLDTDLSIRLSLDQFNLNPFQKGCEALAGTGCASVSVFANGVNGAKVNLSADQASLGRHDRRTIAAGRWEHDFAEGVTWRTQLVWDNRDIKQPTSATAALGTYPSFNLMSDVTANGRLFGLPARHYGGIFANWENINSTTYNTAPGGDVSPTPGSPASLGAVTQTVLGHHLNYGARAREEVDFARGWTAVAGVGVENTELEAQARNWTYPLAAPPTWATIDANRTFFNVAPDVSLSFQPAKEWQIRARVAGGYGTPQATNLFVTPQGVPGNNTDLKPQTNLGVDVGVDWTVAGSLKAGVIGFWEFFRNELVSQSPGANLQSFTFNAPRSEHRGVEVTLDWRPLAVAVPGLQVSAAYLYDDQVYTEYVERLSAGTKSTAFDRSGNKLPGVPPHYVHARVGYDQLAGPLRGLGFYVDSDYRAATPIDNANLVSVPSYVIWSANLHYDRDLGSGLVKGVRLFLEVRNAFDKTYVGSASNVSNTISATTGEQNGAASVSAATGAIWAGAPRTVFGGFRLRL
ncbi:MAG TPA: TonB-dependent receptor [Thermoanaerobaculia bacterium]|nr:TonB-dependent receptor [Thermoanaerobaculia bacterium]